MKRGEVFYVLVIIVCGVVFSTIVWSIFQHGFVGEGIIIDKYPSDGGHKFVLRNEEEGYVKSVYVNISDYYEYEIGDYYKLRWNE